MNGASRILLISLSLFIPVITVVGQRNGANSKRAVNDVSETAFGYNGPVKLGPLSINNRVRGIKFHKLLSMMGGPEAPNSMYVCYYDEAGEIYLVVERGADDPSLVRGLTLSRMQACPEKKISHASGLSTWVTGEEIRLGSTARDVFSKYGEPSSVWDMRTGEGFSPYPREGDHSRMNSRERILVYLPREGAPDTSHAFFGIRNGVVVWMTVRQRMRMAALPHHTGVLRLDNAFELIDGPAFILPVGKITCP